MPITTRKPRIAITPDKKKQLLALIAEAESRGISVPKTAINNVMTFPHDENGYFIKRDGKHFVANENQAAFISSRARFVAFISGRGGGKALDLDTEILTTAGWKTLGTVRVGDYVYGSDGWPKQVLWKSEVMYNHKCYEIHFSDGETVIADAEHLWFTYDKAARKAAGRRVLRKKKNINTFRTYPDIRTTEEIFNTVRVGKRNETNHSIPVCEPLYFDEQDLPIDPYVFGLWLGDGSKSNAVITIAEEEIIKCVEGAGYVLTKIGGSNPYGYTIKIPGVDSILRNPDNGQFVSNENSFHSKLSDLGVLYNKHIPEIYLRSSFTQRINLVQGLMDSDGYIDSRGQMNFDNTNLDLVLGVYELLTSLGIRVSITERDVKLYDKVCGKTYRLLFYTTLDVVMLERKHKRIKNTYSPRVYNRYIVDVIEVDSVPVQCIEVDSEDHLYLVTKSFIPTHNSSSGAQKALKKIASGQNGLVANPTFEDFKTSTWLEFRDWIPWEMVVPNQRYRSNPEWEPHQPFKLAFINGVTVSCKGLNNPDSARGPNINWFWYDEAGKDDTGEAWQIATASVRIGFEPQAWATTTPTGQNWLYEIFVAQDFPQDVLDAYEESGEDRELVEWFETSIIENKDNLDPGFYASILASYPTGYLRQQEVYGKFVEPGGLLGDASWFNDKIIPEPPKKVRSRVRYWDLAASEKKIAKQKRTDPDETVGTLLSWNGEAEFCIEHQECGHWKWKDLKNAVRDTAESDGPLVDIIIEEEPGSGGKNQVEELKLFIQKELGPQWRVTGHNPRGLGDKIMRANTWFAEASQGRFTMVLGQWNRGFLKQLGGFPSFKHDDRIDSVSGARHSIAPIRTWQTVKFLGV